MKRARPFAAALVVLATIAGVSVGLWYSLRRAAVVAGPATQLFGFESGLSGFDVYAEGVPGSASLFLNDDRDFVYQGQRSLGVRVTFGEEGGGVVVHALAGCKRMNVGRLESQVYASKTLAGTAASIYVRSGFDWHLSHATPLLLEEGWNRVIASTSITGASFDLAPTPAPRICEIGFEFRSRAAREGTLFIDGTDSAAMEDPATDSAALDVDLPVEVAVFPGAAGGRISPNLFGLEIMTDISGDVELLRSLRGASSGIARIRLYPSLGRDVWQLRLASNPLSQERVARLVSALRNAGWEPAIVIGETPAWFAAQAPEDRQWVENAAALVTGLNAERRLGISYWEVAPMAPESEEAVRRNVSLYRSMSDAMLARDGSIRIGLGATHLGYATDSSMAQIRATGVAPAFWAVSLGALSRDVNDAASASALVTAEGMRLLSLSLQSYGERRPRLWLGDPYPFTGGCFADMRYGELRSLWAATILTAARNGIDTQFLPLVPRTRTPEGVESAAPLPLLRLLADYAKLRDSDWVPAHSIDPAIAALGLRDKSSWRVGAVVANLTGLPRSVRVTFHHPMPPSLLIGELGRRGDDVTSRRIGVDDVDGKGVVTLVLAPHAVATLQSTALAAPQRDDDGDRSVGDQARPQDRVWKDSWFGAPPSWWRVPVEPGMLVSTAQDHGQTFAEDEIVLFQNSDANAHDSLFAVIRSSESPGSAILQVATAGWNPVSIAKQSRLVLALKSNATASLVVGLMSLDAPPKMLPLSEYLSSPDRVTGWQTAQIPLSSFGDAAAATRVLGVQFALDSTRLAPRSHVTISFDDVAFVH